MIETQDALDHEHHRTTCAYVQSVAVKWDKYSGSIRGRIGVTPVALEQIRKAKNMTELMFP